MVLEKCPRRPGCPTSRGWAAGKCLILTCGGRAPGAPPAAGGVVGGGATVGGVVTVGTTLGVPLMSSCSSQPGFIPAGLGQSTR
jgi:hypothetical protein